MKRRTFLQTLGASGAAVATGAVLGKSQANRRAVAAPLPPGQAPRDDNRRRARLFADTLLQRRGQVGDKNSVLWPALVDTRDMSIPPAFGEQKPGAAPKNWVSTVPSIPGIRDGDRAVGGCNLLHDVATLQLLPILSKISGQTRYGEAAQSYCREFLQRAQNPQTGLLSWGEHLFFDLYSQSASIHPLYSTRGQWPHELLSSAPPWEMLWQADAQRTARAIAGLRFHFYEDKPGALFNRHASWDKPQWQQGGTKGESQPWIKHSGLYVHAFAFLHQKTGEKLWLDWARGTADIYWNARHPQTGLTPGCLTDPRPESFLASAGMTHLAGMLYRAYQILPQETVWRDRALAFFKAYDRFAYDEKHDAYLTRFPTDGSAPPEVINSKKSIVELAFSTSWNAAYGGASTLPVLQGRTAALLARHERDATCLESAKRIHRLARAQALTPQASMAVLSDALHLSLDLHDLTAQKTYLDDAHFYADESVARFWRENERGGFFARAAGDPFYEAKAGGGDLAAGLLRLDLQNSPPSPQNFSWEV